MPPAPEVRATITLDSSKLKAPLKMADITCFEYEGRTILDYIEVQFAGGPVMRLRPVVTHASPNTWGYHVVLQEITTQRDAAEVMPSIPKAQRGSRKAV